MISGSYSQTLKIPSSFQNTFKAKELHKKYLIDSTLRPAFLQSDFNGDKYQDIAVLIRNKGNKKQGILLLHGNTNQVYVFGAGINFGNGSDDFKWMKRWMIYKENRLKTPAIEVSDPESAGGLIYWNGKKYIWIQQGD